MIGKKDAVLILAGELKCEEKSSLSFLEKIAIFSLNLESRDFHLNAFEYF